VPDSVYVTPNDHRPLSELDGGLACADGRHFPFLRGVDGDPIPQFVAGQISDARQAQYHDARAVEIYDNYLAWLFATFGIDEATVRTQMATKTRLNPGGRALVTGCGLGNDLPFLGRLVGVDGALYAQDLSAAMIVAARERTATARRAGTIVVPERVHFSVSDACALPFPDGFFDAAFHFGGLNEFPDRARALNEMRRVVRPGGRVVVGDEGVAPWLRDTEYGRMAICNNKLWAMEPPLAALPTHCANVSLTWILGNCFYLIDFEVADGLPFINPDVAHKGPRGGTMRSRYFGQLEGIEPDLKAKAYAAAAHAGTSVSKWLESAIRKALP
jgi:ubiquinone/menaquinone biosynthesis C-methylase UbiE